MYDLFDFERNWGTIGIHCQVLLRDYEAYVGGSANARESSVKRTVRNADCFWIFPDPKTKSMFIGAENRVDGAVNRAGARVRRQHGKKKTTSMYIGVENRVDGAENRVDGAVNRSVKYTMIECEVCND